MLILLEFVLRDVSTFSFACFFICVNGDGEFEGFFVLFLRYLLGLWSAEC